MAKKHMKKYSPSLAIKEIQIRTTLRFYLTPVRIAIIKNITNWGFQDGDYREEAESMLPKVKSWRDAEDTPCRKNHQEEQNSNTSTSPACA
jgi:hypothetical protein